ncbi:MAG: sulfatase-like hydrolase/transferase [Planctomycetaceae bacterium]
MNGNRVSRLCLPLLLCWCVPALAEDFENSSLQQRPNVLLIIVDDLNDWIGCLGGHPQAKTPHLDRFADGAQLFTNAHCAAPSCNPSRTALFTGLSPHVSGLYDNRQRMRDVLPDRTLLPRWFTQHGYYSAGSGKLLHYFIDAGSWDEYFPPAAGENPFPPTLNPPQRPVNLPVGGPWQYIETDWGPLQATDEEFGGDHAVSGWIGKQLQQSHEKPFFLACGIYRPHEPWFVPQKYFDEFPLEEIQLPPGYREDDLEDLPPAGQRTGPNRYFAHIREQQQWKQGIQGYLASIHFADAMLGRVFAALQNGPNADNTIVMLCSDHGWHLGEKQHWQKYTPWRLCTRIPLIMHVPPGISKHLPEGTTAGVRCDRAVSLVSTFRTLTALCDLPCPEETSGPDITPLLRNARADWPHPAITWLGQPGSWGLSAGTERLVHYANGDEEYYRIDSDPYEWTNLRNEPRYADRVTKLREMAPTDLAKKPEIPVNSLPLLKWVSATEQAPPASRPDGNPFQVVFDNQSDSTVVLHWMDRDGRPKSYGQIGAGERRSQQTRPGAVWMISDVAGTPLGWFRVGDRGARAIVPAPQ